MQINSIQQIQNIKIQNCQNIRNKTISFGNDEFVKTTIDKTYPEIKQEIQKKYQPQIADLRQQRKNLAKVTRTTIYDSYFNNKDIKSGIDSFFYLKDYYLTKSVDKELQKQVKNTDVFLKKIYNNIYSFMCGNKASIEHCNNFMFKSKDRKFAQDLLDFTDFYYRMLYILPSLEEYGDKYFLNTKCKKFIPRFIKINDNFKDKDDMLEKLAEVLEESEKYYKETNRPSIINFENLDKLLDARSNTKSEIATMKDILSRTPWEYHTMLTFITDKQEHFGLGINEPHRISPVFDIDKEGLTIDGLSHLKPINKHVDNLKKAIEKYQNTYYCAHVKYLELTREIKELQKQCREEVNKIDKKACKSGSNNTSFFNTNAPANKKTIKPIAIALGIVTLGMAAIYKSGLFSKNKQLRQSKNIIKQNNNQSDIFKDFV